MFILMPYPLNGCVINTRLGSNHNTVNNFLDQ